SGHQSPDRHQAYRPRSPLKSSPHPNEAKLCLPCDDARKRFLAATQDSEAREQEAITDRLPDIRHLHVVAVDAALLDRPTRLTQALGEPCVDQELGEGGIDRRLGA